MAQTNVNIMMDEATKIAFDKFCQEIGLSVSAAFNIFAKTVVREQRIPFEVNANDPFYSAVNMERLRKSAAQMEQTGGTVHEIGAAKDD